MIMDAKARMGSLTMVLMLIDRIKTTQINDTYLMKIEGESYKKTKDSNL